MKVKVDRREGSGHLVAPLRKLGLELSHAPVTLPYGDVEFHGWGPTGRIKIGIEIKTLSELLSAIQSKRFVGRQLRGMCQTYPARYLLVRGVWRAAPGSGVLQSQVFQIRKGRPGRYVWVDAGFGRRRFMYSEFVEWLNGLPIRVIFCRTEAEILHTVFGLVRWWHKPWEKHGSLKVIYDGLPGGGSHALHLEDDLTPLATALEPVSSCRTAMAVWPGVGWEYSAAAESAFGSVIMAAVAPAEQWAKLRAPGLTKEGRKRPRLGMTRALRIRAFLRGQRFGPAQVLPFNRRRRA